MGDNFNKDGAPTWGTTKNSEPGDFGASFTAHLELLANSIGRPLLCKAVLPNLIRCIASISQTLRRSHQVSLVGSANAFGDEQLNVDVIAEKIIRSSIAECESVVVASSEEDPVEKRVHGMPSPSLPHTTEQYTIAFDPLDGSSIIGPNWTVGTIIGIWDGQTALGQSPAEKQVAAVLGVYGPRTTAIVAVREAGHQPVCLEIALDAGDDGQNTDKPRIELVRPQVKLPSPPFKTRYFAPANLRAASENENYGRLISDYIRNKYTLRYSGGLVPDIVHALVKGHGVYISPVTRSSEAKLRRLYELAPVALIVECCGGMAVDPVNGVNILDTAINDCDERAGLLCGTAEEVKKALKLLND